MTDDTEMLIRIDSIDQLFNAPSIDPFSDKPAIILGEAALMYAVREQLGQGLFKWNVSRMVIQLPADQITPEIDSQVVDAVRRYAEFKYKENQILIHVSRWRSLLRLSMAIVFVLVILLIANALARSLLASASSAVMGALGGFLTIIIWATVWGPWDKLIYEWLDPASENYLLRRIATVEIILRPEPPSASGEAGESLEPNTSAPSRSSRPVS
jgi:hypothetical protein